MMKTKTAIGITAAMLLMCGWSGLTHAESRTISAIIPWQGEGRIFQIATDKLRFLGTLEGIMYVETAEGEMDEAFVRCPIVQDIDVNDQSTSVTGSCMIVARRRILPLPKLPVRDEPACVAASSSSPVERAGLPASAGREK